MRTHALEGIPAELRGKWRLLGPSDRMSKPSAKKIRRFDAQGLRLIPARDFEGVLEADSGLLCGRCDRCDGEGHALLLLRDSKGGALLQMGKTCFKRSLATRE